MWPSPWQACAGQIARAGSLREGSLSPTSLLTLSLAFLQNTQVSSAPNVHPGKLCLCAYVQQSPHPATSTCPCHITIPWIKKSSSRSLLILVSSLFLGPPYVGTHIPAPRMIPLGKTSPFLPSFLCLFIFLSQYPYFNFLRPQNSFRSWNLYIISNSPLFFTTRMQRYCGPAPAACKASQVHVTSLTQISFPPPCADVSLPCCAGPLCSPFL